MKSKTKLYEKFGLAAEAGQLLETDLVTSILALEGLKKGWIQTPDPVEAKRMLTHLDGLTLGRLVRDLKIQLNISEPNISFLGRSLETRNELNHGFFEKHGETSFVDPMP